MSDTYYKNQPAPGTSSAEGAYMRNPGQPSYYFSDANMYGTQNVQQMPVAQVAPAERNAANVPAENTGLKSWFNVTDGSYLKGAAIGAGIALVVTNPTVQKAVVSGAVRLWSSLQGGVEEVKEQVLDIKAEMSREG